MKLHIDCECGSDILKVEKAWEDREETKFQIWLCMFKSYSGGFWNRIPALWNYIRFGEFYYNDMYIDEKDLDRLINFLEEVKKSDAVKDD